MTGVPVVTLHLSASLKAVAVEADRAPAALRGQRLRLFLRFRSLSWHTSALYQRRSSAEREGFAAAHSCLKRSVSPSRAFTTFSSVGHVGLPVPFIRTLTVV